MVKLLRRNNVMVFLLAFIGMTCWGIAPLFVKLGLKDVNPLVGLAIRTAFTILILTSLMFIDGSFSKLKSISLSVFILLGIEAVLATLIGDLAYFAAIKRGSISLVTVIMASSPLVTIICSILFLGEQITLARAIGAGLIILGIVIAV
jgi:bacterial/archaeal transporter family protein